MGTSIETASARKIAVKVSGRSTSTTMPPMTPPRPMPRLTRAKLMPKYCWRAGPETTAAMRALKAGHDVPKLKPMKRKARATAAGVVAKARITQPTSWEVVASSSISRAPMRSVSEPPGAVTARAKTAMSDMSRPDSPSSMPRTSCR